jgi:hypothetical protein
MAVTQLKDVRDLINLQKNELKYSSIDGNPRAARSDLDEGILKGLEMAVQTIDDALVNLSQGVRVRPLRDADCYNPILCAQGPLCVACVRRERQDADVRD